MWKLAGFIVMILTIGIISLDQLGYDPGLSKAITAFKVAVGMEPSENETFSGCIKGAYEGAFSTAVPVAEIVATGELVLAGAPLVIMGARLGCSLGSVKSVALEGAGWAVHTGSEIIDAVFGR